MHYVAGESRSCAPFCFAAVVCLNIFTWLSTCCSTSNLFELYSAVVLSLQVAIIVILFCGWPWGDGSSHLKPGDVLHEACLSSWLRWRALLFPFLLFVLQVSAVVILHLEVSCSVHSHRGMTAHSVHLALSSYVHSVKCVSHMSAKCCHLLVMQWQGGGWNSYSISVTLASCRKI